MSENPKKQVNVYFPKDLHRDIQYEVFQQKEADAQYSVTAFVEEACRLALMVRRYQREARSTQSPYDFTMDALKTFLDIRHRPRG